MEHLRHVGVFATAAGHASFAAAGEALGLTGSAVSKSIAVLEASMGVALFHRTNRGILLTTDGRAFHERCRSILDQLGQAQAELTDSRGLVKGRLRVLLHPGPARAVIVPALPSFLRKHPDLDLEVRLDYDAADFVARGIDACVLYGEPVDTWGASGPRSNLVSLRLSESHVVTCAAASYLATRGMPRRPQDLVDLDCLAMVAADGSTLSRWRFVRGNQRVQVDVRPLLAINDGPALVNAALAGQGVIHLPAFNLAPRLERNELVQLLPEWRSPAPPVTVVFAEAARKLTRLRVFVDFLTALFGQATAPQASIAVPDRWPIRRAIKHRRSSSPA